MNMNTYQDFLANGKKNVYLPSTRTPAPRAAANGGADSALPSLPVGVTALEAAPPEAEGVDSFFSGVGGRLSMTGRRFPVSSLIW